ncbi:MAG: DUF4013 domain-containing protein [Deltaproteobacteria bacterium]|nr:DUF4013 domain-containing protein [Deltaproteobacteria bacterium]
MGSQTGNGLKSINPIFQSGREKAREERGAHMNIKEALRNPARDKKWVGKVLIGGLLSTTLTSVIANGYLMIYLRSLLQHDEADLPPWSHIREILKATVRLIVVDFVYALPAIFLGIMLSRLVADLFDMAIILIPVGLVTLFFLNIAHVLFAINDYKIAAGLNIKKTLLLLRLKSKEYLPIYIFSSLLFLLGIAWGFIVITFGKSIGTVLKYFYQFILSLFIFYSGLVISNLLSMVFRDLKDQMQEKQTNGEDGEIRREKRGRVRRLGRLGLGLD